MGIKWFFCILTFLSLSFLPPALSVTEEIKIPSGLSSEKLFYHHILQARELKEKGNISLAIQYYRKGLQEKCSDSSHYLKGLSELVFLLEEAKDFNGLKNEIIQLENFAQKIGFLKKNPEYQFMIDYFKVISSQDLVKNAIAQDYTYFEDTLFYPLILEYELKTRIKKEMYEEAYKMFYLHPSHFDQHDYRFAHDLLAVILKKSPSKWHCEDSLREFPSSSSPVIELCRQMKTRSFNFSSLRPSLENSGLGYLLPALSKQL